MLSIVYHFTFTYHFITFTPSKFRRTLTLIMFLKQEENVLADLFSLSLHSSPIFGVSVSRCSSHTPPHPIPSISISCFLINHLIFLPVYRGLIISYCHFFHLFAVAETGLTFAHTHISYPFAFSHSSSISSSTFSECIGWCHHWRCHYFSRVSIACHSSGSGTRHTSQFRHHCIFTEIVYFCRVLLSFTDVTLSTSSSSVLSFLFLSNLSSFS